MKITNAQLVAIGARSGDIVLVQGVSTLKLVKRGQFVGTYGAPAYVVSRDTTTGDLVATRDNRL